MTVSALTQASGREFHSGRREFHSGTVLTKNECLYLYCDRKQNVLELETVVMSGSRISRQ